MHDVHGTANSRMHANEYALTQHLRSRSCTQTSDKLVLHALVTDVQPLRIWAEEYSDIELAPGVFLATYVECTDLQTGQHLTRQCSAVLLADQQAPHGYTWRSVHETWLKAPEAPPAAAAASSKDGPS